MGLLEHIAKTEFLGSEFLTWLWFKSETNNGLFDIEEVGKIELWFYDDLKLEKGGKLDKESLVCKGSASDLKEAKLGLSAGKKLKEARIKLIVDDEEWFLTLDSLYLDFKQLKTPKVEIDSFESEQNEKDALFYEKIFLIEKAVSIIDNLLQLFIKDRMSPQWASESVAALNQWIRRGIENANDE
jgi:recombination associated protein RdgC